MSFFEKIHDEKQMQKQYLYLKEQLDIVLQKSISKEDRKLFGYYQTLAELLSEKAGIGNRLRQAYRTNDRQTLAELQNNLLVLADLAEKLRLKREEIWMSEYKPFGYEILDIRLGGVGTRAKSARKRIDDYLDGKCLKIAELEEDILPYETFDSTQNQQGNYFWDKIISMGNIEGI